MESTTLFLLLLLRFISATRYESFISRQGLRVPIIYKQIEITKQSEIVCAHSCTTDLHCRTANFNNKTLSCQLSVYHPDDIHVADKIIEEDNWMLLYKKNGLEDNWMVLFRGTQKIGIDVADSFIGTNVNSLHTPDPECYYWGNPVCNTHIRSPLIDNWDNLNITKVKVDYRTKGETVAYVIFQNSETDNIITWFSPANILSSSWTDLPSQTSDYALFGLERGGTQGHRRSFTMYDTLSGCTTSKGWMFVSEVTGSGWYCSNYENLDPLPVFLYAKGSTAQFWDSGPGVADVMLISIKT